MDINKVEILDVTTDAQREAVYRFRYDIYVEEMGRYRDVADHEGRRLVEPFEVVAESLRRIPAVEEVELPVRILGDLIVEPFPPNHVIDGLGNEFAIPGTPALVRL